MDERTARKIQSYGETHPEFHSKGMKEYREKDKANAKKEHLARKMKGDTKPASREHVDKLMAPFHHK